MNDFTETATEISIKHTDAISIVQITDTHILAEDATLFHEYDTSASLNNVIKQIKNVEQDTDLVLLTGDLVHEPTKASYQKLADSLSSLTAPLYCLPGNHDNPETMQYIMGTNGVDASKLVKLGNWLLILLNSHVTGEHSGLLSEDELSFLHNSLHKYSDLHCLIALHHQPVSINSSWMDSMNLRNANAFFKIIDQFKQVKAIIWGHIHQEFEAKRDNVMLFGTPSTCLQFQPGADTFKIDDKPPAYRNLMLVSDGTIKTRVVYL